MNRYALALIAFVLRLGTPILGQIADESSVPRISLADFKKAFDAGQVLVVDVRAATSYADGHIPGARSIPLDALREKALELKGAKKLIITYCT